VLFVDIRGYSAFSEAILTALGNTTNRAARLQAMTRELRAAIVIDSLTRDRAGSAAARFARREAVPIRGRLEREDLSVLAIAACRPLMQRVSFVMKDGIVYKRP
jgi:class 3 adenylate cyclase